MLDEKWTYWEGRVSNPPCRSMENVEDPVDKGTCVMSDDREADGGKYGAGGYRDQEGVSRFPVHIEFLIPPNRRQQRRLSAKPL